MQINQTVISNAIELALNWLTEQVAGRLDTNLIKPNGQPMVSIDTLNMTPEQKNALDKAIREQLWTVREELQKAGPLLTMIKDLNPEQEQEFHKIIEDYIASSSRVIDLRFLDTEQNNALGRIIESYGRELDLINLSNDERQKLDRFIRDALENTDLNIPSDDDIEEKVNDTLSSYSWESDDEWKSAVESVISDEMSNYDFEDDLRRTFNTSSVLENAIRENQSSIADALDINNAVYEALRYSGSVDQEVRDIALRAFEDNIDMGKRFQDYIQTQDGAAHLREAVADVIDERVSAKMREIFQALERNI